MEPWWNPVQVSREPSSNHPAAGSLRRAGGTLVETWWNPCNLKPPRTSPRRWWNPGGTLVEDGRLVEPWWNPGGTLVKPCWNPRGTFLKPARTTPQPSKKLVEPWWNPRGTLPQTTPDHPAALAEPGGTLVETSQMVEIWWKPGGSLVEPWWNPGGTLAQGRPEPPRSLSGLRPQSFQLLGKNISILTASGKSPAALGSSRSGTSGIFNPGQSGLAAVLLRWFLLASPFRMPLGSISDALACLRSVHSSKTASRASRVDSRLEANRENFSGGWTE